MQEEIEEFLSSGYWVRRWVTGSKDSGLYTPPSMFRMRAAQHRRSILDRPCETPYSPT